MSYRDLRNFCEHLRLLGYPRPVSLESFRRPDFPLMAELLAWLVRRLEPEAALVGGGASPEDRVALVRSAVLFLATKEGIKVNGKRLYGADGHAVRELLKLSGVLCAALAGGAGAGAGEGEHSPRPQYDVSARLTEIKRAKQLATEITSKGAILHDLLAKEPEYKIIRERAPTRPLDLAATEACMARAIALVRARIDDAREQSSTAAAADRALQVKIEKRKGELQRAEMRLQSMQKIKPAYQTELVAVESELAAAWQQFVLRHRCVEALRLQLSARDGARAEAAEQQRAAVLQLIHKYEAEDVLGAVSDSDEVSEEEAPREKPPRPVSRPRTRLRIKTAGGDADRTRVFGAMDELDRLEDDDSATDSGELLSDLLETGRPREGASRHETALGRYSARPAPPRPRSRAAHRARDTLAEGPDGDGVSLGSSGDSAPAAGGGARDVLTDEEF